MKIIRSYPLQSEAELARIALEGADIPEVVVGVGIGMKGGVLLVPEVDLTRFRGHPKVRFGGVHDGRQIGPVHPGIQATNGRAGTHGAYPGVAGEGVRPHAMDDLPVDQAGRARRRQGRWRFDERGARGAHEAAA